MRTVAVVVGAGWSRWIYWRFKRPSKRSIEVDDLLEVAEWLCATLLPASLALVYWFAPVPPTSPTSATMMEKKGVPFGGHLSVSPSKST